MSIKLFSRFFALCLIISAPFATFSAPVSVKTHTLCFAAPLQSNMVVQQNKPFKVWGFAKPGKPVVITAGWLKQPLTVTATADGKFLGIVDVPVAVKGNYTEYTLNITSDKETNTLTNLLIGDLWFCSGQSNMQFAMREIKGNEKEIAAANNPHLRILNVRFNWNSIPVVDFEGTWTTANPKAVNDFSVIGYYFGQELQQKLDIPIGVMYSGVGGSVAQAYVSHKVLAADKRLSDAYLANFYTTDRYKKNELDRFTFGTTSDPYLIYNGMINPILNMSFKGICWYQGESNREERDNYVYLMNTMIKEWREEFAQPDLPFYYVQVAPHAYQKLDPMLNDYAFFREKQEEISKINNTAMVVTMDVGDAENIHPTNKRPVAERLARVALNRSYNMLNVNYKGPHYNYFTVDKEKATIHFEADGITTGLKTSDGAAPKHFMVAGADQVFHPANAEIKGNEIIVSASEVKNPVAVRYAFTNYPTTNLQNGDGIPAVPFRTDNWAEPVSNKAKP